MKTGLLRMLVIAGVAVFTAYGCGSKFTPLTQDQINAKADSIFNAQKDAKLTELRAACDAGVQAQADAKFETLKQGETASK